MSTITSNQNGNPQQSVEITVLVELFSTFFDKVTLQHPEKDQLMKDLSSFKGFLYNNQQNLNSGYDFLSQLKKQKMDQNGTNEIDQFKQQPQQQQQQQQVVEFKRAYLKPNCYKLVNIQEFQNLKNNRNNKEQIMNQLQQQENIQKLREFGSEVNTSYRCISFGILEKILGSEKKDEELREIIMSVEGKQIVLKNYFDDSENQRNKLKSKFIGYLQHFINNNNNCQELVDDLYVMINCDNDFELALLSYIKEKTIVFAQSHNYYQSELISQIQSTADATDQIFNLIASAFDLEIVIHNLLMSKQVIKGNIGGYNNNQYSQNTQIHLLKQANPYPVYNLVYQGQKQQQQQQIHNINTYANSSNNNNNNINIHNTGNCSICNLQVQRSQELVKIRNCVHVFDVQCFTNYVKNKISINQSVKCPVCYVLIQSEDYQMYIMPNRSSMDQASSHAIDSQISTDKTTTASSNISSNKIEDLKNKAEYLKHMLIMFEENNDILNEKFNQLNQIDQQEESQDVENMENILRDQITNSKSRAVNFYHNFNTSKDPYRSGEYSGPTSQTKNFQGNIQQFNYESDNQQQQQYYIRKCVKCKLDINSGYLCNNCK